jgi:predicted anti-sigma-YlaC factor YlaD
MKTCSWIRKRLIDRLEGELTEVDARAFDSHLEQCPGCRHEFEQVSTLYSKLSGDDVPLPSDEFWENTRQRIRQRSIPLEKNWWLRKLMPVTAAVVAACLVVLLLVRKPSQTIEMVVPVSEMLEDEDIATIALATVVHNDVFEEFLVIEESLPFDIDETIGEMTPEEQELLIKLITRPSGAGT